MSSITFIELDAVLHTQKVEGASSTASQRRRRRRRRMLAAIKIQKRWRGMKGRERYVEWWAHRWWGRECAAVKIQCVWRGVLTREGKTPNSWWIKALRGWNKQVCCPHRSMVWIHPAEAGPPL